uniref:Uncharacterized protein n=1 Tax=Strigamia maritima TaxID=126957 RepID=T1JAE7_STRMM
MISHRITSLAVAALCCIAFAASTPISTTFSTSTPIVSTQPEPPCRPPVADSDVLLYQSFESMQKWADNKLAAKYEDVKQGAAQEMTKFQETIHEQTKQQLKSFQQAVNEEKREILQKFSQSQETITSNLDAMKTEMNQLRAQLSELMSNVGGHRVNEFKDQIRNGLKEQNQQIQHQATIIQDVNNRLSQCVTDIKVSASESVVIWKGPGYGDEANRGYVLTGVVNFNRDKYVDSANRRQVLFLKNNAWTPLHE